MKRLIYFLVLIILVSTTYISCKKEKLFPAEPSIEFKEFVKYQSTSPAWDSADCVIKFKDGDGDIGMGSDDLTSTPDFQMKYLYDSIITINGIPTGVLSGVFVQYDKRQHNPPYEPLIYYYRVPDITPTGQYKALEGEIRAKLRAAPFYVPGHTKIKYEITLRDRAGHVSNTLTTDEIQVP